MLVQWIMSPILLTRLEQITNIIVQFANCVLRCNTTENASYQNCSIGVYVIILNNICQFYSRSINLNEVVEIRHSPSMSNQTNVLNQAKQKKKKT